MPQHLVRAVADRDRRPRRRAGLARVSGFAGVVEGEVDVHLVRGRHRLDAGAAPPERVERPVVDGVVLGPAHERGPARPVDRRPPHHSHRLQRLDEGGHVADRDIEPRAAYDARERHRDAIDRQVRRVRLRHRAPPPPGRPRRGRGPARAPGPRGT